MRRMLACTALAAAAAGAVAWAILAGSSTGSRPAPTPPAPPLTLSPETVDRLVARAGELNALSPVTVDYPREDSLFPPDMAAPTFLWHDAAEGIGRWIVSVSFEGRPDAIRLSVPGDPPPAGRIDPRCLGPTNAVYQPTPYQASARSWTPDEATWSAIKAASVAAPAQVTVLGVRRGSPPTVVSRGRLTLRTSTDPVGAPIFYRDVPLMPSLDKTGVIQPLATSALPLIQWRLRDVSRPDSRVVLQNMPTCANCHSFSADGKTLAMDVDGPSGDKGAYAIAPITADLVIGEKDIITWNSFEGKPPEAKTIGFLSQVSPDGRFAVSTVNESVYVVNFPQYAFGQVFYPVRGILACYSRADGKMKALPGADDPRFVHAGAAWAPDGKSIVFSRAPAQDPFDPNEPLAAYANDPKERPLQYDLYRIPFNDGAGGKPEPIAGASANGMSNTFPKVSPDGRWIVFVQCRNGQLMRPDSTLWIVPASGGPPRKMRCNTSRMNSWHSFSPNGRWMVFSSKADTPYTQMFLTHIDPDGNDTPPILVPNATDANRAVNIPEFVNRPFESMQSIAIPSTEYYRHYDRAIRLGLEGKFADSIRLFQKALEYEPRSARIHKALALCLADAGQLEEAVRRYAVAIDCGGDAASLLCDRGVLLARLRRFEEALADFDRAIQLRPAYSPAWHNRARTWEMQKNWARALSDYDEAVRLAPGSAQSHSFRGLVLCELKRWKDADLAFTRALELDGRQFDIYPNRAIARARLRDFSGARSDLLKSLELAPPTWPRRPVIQRMLDDLRRATAP